MYLGYQSLLILFFDDIFVQVKIFLHEHIECNRKYFLCYLILQGQDQNQGADRLVSIDSKT